MGFSVEKAGDSGGTTCECWDMKKKGPHPRERPDRLAFDP
jgi:hypothetical protein